MSKEKRERWHDADLCLNTWTQILKQPPARIFVLSSENIKSSNDTFCFDMLTLPGDDGAPWFHVADSSYLNMLENTVLWTGLGLFRICCTFFWDVEIVFDALFFFSRLFVFSPTFRIHFGTFCFGRTVFLFNIVDTLWHTTVSRLKRHEQASSFD